MNRRIYMRMCDYTHFYMHIHVYVSAYMRICIRTYAYTYTHLRVYLCAHTRIIIRKYAYIYSRIMHVFLVNVYLSSNVAICVNIFYLSSEELAPITLS